MMRFFVVLVSAAVALAHHGEELHTAIVHLVGKNVEGTVTFAETEDHKVRVQGMVSGMSAGEYGFHVHEKGDVSGGCGTTGAHFNPEKKDHGHPNDENRHVGDLGNIVFDDQGSASFDFVDNMLALRGPHNIIGRAVVLHEKQDDYGRSSHPDSRKTGNAGGRVACGVIGLKDPVYGNNAHAAKGIGFIFLMFIYNFVL
ncbi:hypothetical protein ACJJTC_008480 [Scirpophaga incertulas]